MLKHMLTPNTGHPRTRTNSRKPSVPTMEALHGSPVLEPLNRLESRRDRDESRPVSVHGNVIHNQSIYANTVPIAKMNGGLNISTTSATGHNNTRPLGGSMNANLNLSNLNSSSNASPGTNQTRTTIMDSSREHSHHELNTTQISPISRSMSRHTANIKSNNILMSPGGDEDQNTVVLGRRRSQPLNSTIHQGQQQQNGGLNITNSVGRRLNASLVPANVSRFMVKSEEAGVKEMITSLALLCLVSLLLALLSLVFLFKITPEPMISRLDESERDDGLYVVYEVTLAMCALSLSLNLCCLLVCAIQFIFAVKLVRASHGKARTTKYLKEASLTRTCAIAGFFISIPVFLTGIILYMFLHFDSIPAIVTSILVGLGIVFCAAAVVHNVFIWQREKSKNIKVQNVQTLKMDKNDILNRTNNKSQFELPQATLDLSGPNNATYISAKGLELSTLV